MGMVLKGHTHGKWQVIMDLSSPLGGSVNDGIKPHLCSMNYVTILMVASTISQLGIRALLAKIDIESAFGPILRLSKL